MIPKEKVTIKQRIKKEFPEIREQKMKENKDRKDSKEVTRQIHDGTGQRMNK